MTEKWEALDPDQEELYYGWLKANDTTMREAARMRWSELSAELRETFPPYLFEIAYAYGACDFVKGLVLANGTPLPDWVKSI